MKCSLFLHAVVVIFLIAVTDNLGGNKEEKILVHSGGDTVYYGGEDMGTVPSTEQESE